MNPKPTIEFRRRLPFFWLVLLAILAVLLPSRVWNTLLIGLGGMLLAAYIWARLLANGISGSRRLRFGWVAVGDRLSEHFEIRNDSQLSALWVEVVDESSVPGYRPAVVRSVGANDVDSWRQSAICQQRGQFSLGPWALHTADPFGIFRVTISYPKTNEIVIHPPIHTQLPIPLPAGQSSGRVRARERSWQATINAATVREYQTHDPLRWIHWPSTARHDKLLVREFDLDAAGDIWLLLDMQESAQLGQGPDGTEEHAVLLAAALSAQALHQNRAVGLATYGRDPHIIHPGRGQGQQWQLLRALALVTADGESDLSLALRDTGRVALRGSSAVIITPSERADWLPNLISLTQRGIRAQVILFDRPTFRVEETVPPPASSQGLYDAIRQLGVTCHLIQQGQVGQPIDERDRRGFWEFKVTGTGKVITSRSPFE